MCCSPCQAGSAVISTGLMRRIIEVRGAGQVFVKQPLLFCFFKDGIPIQTTVSWLGCFFFFSLYKLYCQLTGSGPDKLLDYVIMCFFCFCFCFFKYVLSF